MFKEVNVCVECYRDLKSCGNKYTPEKCNNVKVTGIFKSEEMAAKLITLARCVVVKERT